MGYCSHNDWAVWSRVWFPTGTRDFSKISRLDLEHTQHPVQWVPGVLFWGVEGPERESGHLSPCSGKVKNEWSYVILIWCFGPFVAHALHDKYKDSFTFSNMSWRQSELGWVAVLNNAIEILHFSFQVLNCFIPLNKVTRHSHHKEDNPEKCCSAVSADCVQRQNLATSVWHEGKGVACD